MAAYKARPFYEVKVGKRTVVFDYFGEYRTENVSVIAALDGLVPAYIQRIDEPKAVAPKEEQTRVKTEEKPKTRKSSAK